ncbi:MAG: PA14 domain-containing protein [Anaerolineae bacterium]
MQNSRPARESWDWDQDPAEEESGGGSGYLVLLLVLLAAIVVCITGFFVARILLSDRQPVALPGLATGTSLLATAVPGASPGEPTSSSGPAQITVDPQQGYVGTLITVAGQGWWPGEPVFVFMRSPAESESEGYAYAAAVADDGGAIRTAFTFPNEMRWMNQAWAEILARGTRSDRQAAVRFTLIVPSPTATVPPPTPGPTLPATETPSPTVTGLPATATTPPPASFPDWRGEYFANESLSGDPIVLRNDPAIDFNWVEGSPDPRLPVDRFSARWTRQIQFVEGYYRFVLSADDGVRLWIDGQLVVDEWRDGVLTDHGVDLYLSGGGHGFRLEYYENLGGAMVQLRWSQEAPPTATSTPTPTWTPTATPTPSPTQLLPTDTPTATSPPPTSAPGAVLPQTWWGEYFGNASLEGPPVLQRQDGEMLFYWGNGSPDPSVPADGFSARWTADLWLPAGDYTYVLMADDGARFWIDGGLVIDAWTGDAGQLRYGQVSLAEGVHSFRVEYYESTLTALIRLQGKAGDR